MTCWLASVLYSQIRTLTKVKEGKSLGEKAYLPMVYGEEENTSICALSIREDNMEGASLHCRRRLSLLELFYARLYTSSLTRSTNSKPFHFVS